MLNQKQLDMQLIMAVNEGDALALSQALADGANAKFKNSYALQHAAQRGHAECVRRLIPVSDPLAEESMALRWAALYGNAGCVALLLPVSDALALRGDNSSMSALARCNGHLKVAEMIEAFIESQALSSSLDGVSPKSVAKKTL